MSRKPELETLNLNSQQIKAILELMKLSTLISTYRLSDWQYHYFTNHMDDVGPAKGEDAVKYIEANLDATERKYL